MEKFKLKQQDPQKSVSAAFDSVALITKLIGEPLTDDTKNTIERNVKHLEIMLGKESFVEELTQEQKTEIDSVIESGSNYIVTQ
jgi:hypothetical protein